MAGPGWVGQKIARCIFLEVGVRTGQMRRPTDMVASIQSSGVSKGSGPSAGGDASAVALQAQEAARLLAESNERVAAHAAAASQMTQEKLLEIHVLVDGAYTASMRGELNALKAHQATLRELIADRRGSGREPGKDTISTLNALEMEIAGLEVGLQERLEAVAKAEKLGQTDLR